MRNAQVLTFAVGRAGLNPVVYLRGELDLTGAGAVEAALLQVGGSTVVADLRGLTFIDGAGIRALLRAKRCIEAQGCRLLVRNAGGIVRRIIALAGADRLL